MFSLSLSTGLQPELAPLSPYTLVVANLNALLAQLLFAFLSAAGTGISKQSLLYHRKVLGAQCTLPFLAPARACEDLI
jgi:hypothetical protein